MKQFTGLEYLKIDVANSFGLDKANWEDRLIWFELNQDKLEELVEQAEEKFMYTKAVNAYRKTMRGEPCGHMMFLDATASGLQIMAALSGCKKTAKHVNLINTGKREDVYEHVAREMNQMLKVDNKVDRDLIKKPVMTHYYNKNNQDTLDEAQQEAFYKELQDSFTGAEDVKQVLNDVWNSHAYVHEWTLPDGHVSSVKVTEVMATRVEVDELDHLTFTYQFENNQPSTRSTSLAPNVVHSIDGYVAREMVRRAQQQGFELVHIHDA